MTRHFAKINLFFKINHELECKPPTLKRSCNMSKVGVGWVLFSSLTPNVCVIWAGGKDVDKEALSSPGLGSVGQKNTSCWTHHWQNLLLTCQTPHHCSSCVTGSLFAENAHPSFMLLASSILGSTESDRVIPLTQVAKKNSKLEYFFFFSVRITQFCMCSFPG